MGRAPPSALEMAIQTFLDDVRALSGEGSGSLRMRTGRAAGLRRLGARLGGQPSESFRAGVRPRSHWDGDGQDGQTATAERRCRWPRLQRIVSMSPKRWRRRCSMQSRGMSESRGRVRKNDFGAGTACEPEAQAVADARRGRWSGGRPGAGIAGAHAAVDSGSCWKFTASVGVYQAFVHLGESKTRLPDVWAVMLRGKYRKSVSKAREMRKKSMENL